MCVIVKGKSYGGKVNQERESASFSPNQFVCFAEVKIYFFNLS